MLKYKPHILIFALLSLAVLLVYSNTFQAEFHYDDSVNITRNDQIQIKSLDMESLKGALFAGGRRGTIYHPVLYRPVAMLSFALNYYFDGVMVLKYHIVNISIHIITSAFLFLVILQMLNLPALRERFDGMQLQIAGIAALLWALNPVQLTNITYIVQRQNAMAGMFYIMAICFYLTARMGKKHLFYVLAALSSILAMGSKENAIMLPWSLLLLDLLLIQGISWASIKRTGLVSLGLLGASVLVIIGLQGVETFSIDTLIQGYTKRNFTLGQRLLTEPYVMILYLMLLFMPFHQALCLTHTVPVSHGIFDPPHTLISILLIAGLIALAVMKAKQRPFISFAILFFFLNHVVEGTVFPLELVYEHRNYIPSFFVFVPAAMVLVYAYYHWQKIVMVGATVCLAVFFGYNTYVQNAAWKNTTSLWADVIQKNPDPRSVFNYAGGLFMENNYGEALRYWDITHDFNNLYGTNYNQDPRVIPYGTVMFMAGRNATKLRRKLAEVNQ